jgi:hypothetical protein
MRDAQHRAIERYEAIQVTCSNLPSMLAVYLLFGTRQWSMAGRVAKAPPPGLLSAVQPASHNCS